MKRQSKLTVDVVGEQLAVQHPVGVVPHVAQPRVPRVLLRVVAVGRDIYMLEINTHIWEYS